MPFLQSSGAISINDIRNLFGGPASPSLSNYYRGGAYVPSSKTVSTIVREPSSGEYYDRGAYGFHLWAGFFNEQYASGYSGSRAYWFNYTPVGYAAGGATSLTAGGYTYYRGGYRGQTYTNTYDGYVTLTFYGVYRQSGSSYTASINNNVPTSGSISLSQLYGAEKP